VVGVSEATVRRRVKNLLSQRVIEIVACVDPPKVGLEVEALVFLQTDLDKLTQIGQQLAGMAEVREVIYSSGIYDLVASVALPSSDDLLPFLTQRVAAIPGIRSTQTAYVLHVKKRPIDWQLPEAPAQARPPAPGPLLLLVDDDADFCAAARMVLEAKGYRIEVACNGREALACLQKERPELILVDVVMETPLAGLEAAQAIQADERLEGVPLLAISAIRSSEWGGILPPLEELPFDGFLDKPIEPAELLEQVNRLIG